MSVLQVKPKFLYPCSRQFPFDEVVEKIVKALEKRNWSVPGIVVNLYNYGSGETKYKMVDEIEGDNFVLRFGRIQGKLNPRLNDIAAVNEVCIPKQSINVYQDESGPYYYMYAGENWEKDKEWFMEKVKLDPNYSKEPQRYLTYTGPKCFGRATELVYNNYSLIDCMPITDEPYSINLDEKFKEFTLWLEQNVLEYILAYPEQEAMTEGLQELIPYKGQWPLIFSLCSVEDAERILKGKENPEHLTKEDRHARFGQGRPLLSTFSKKNGKLPKVVAHNFIWCDVNQELNRNSNYEHILEWIINEMNGLFHKLIAIKLKYANDVYVIDYYKYVETIYAHEMCSYKVIKQALISRASTIVPINEYKGNYTSPVVIIDRELDFDEIEWINYEQK